MNKGKYSYSDKSHAKNLGHKKSHGNPSNLHSSRSGSTVKRPKSSAAGLQGLSIGQKVPMEMFDQKYQKPDIGSMGKITDANKMKKGMKRAVSGSQKKFFGL